MSDIVARLRKHWIDELSDDDMTEAADEIDRLRDVLRQCADDLEAYVKAQYPAGSFVYPSLQRKYEADMEPVHRARSILPEATD